MIPEDPSIDRLLRRAQAEYLEMPGLCLTGHQAQRLWGLNDHECRLVLRALVDTGFLAETDRGAFIRADHRVGAVSLTPGNSHVGRTTGR